MNMDGILLSHPECTLLLAVVHWRSLGCSQQSLFALENQSPFICANRPPVIREKNNRDKTSLALQRG